MQELLEIKLSAPPEGTTERLNAFIKDFQAATRAHPFARHLDLWGTDDQLVGFEVSKFDGRIHLGAIMSFVEKGAGNGSAAMKWFTDLADKHNVEIELAVKPIPGAGATNKKSLTKSQLKTWYKKFGFVPSGGDDYMIRKPKSNTGE